MVKYLKRGNEVRELEELQIICDKDSPQTLNQEILIKAVYSGKEKIEYKFIIGNDGVWNTVQDFSEISTYRWTPKNEGNYIIMVQGKQADSRKSFHCIVKKEYVIKEKKNDRLIEDIIVSNESITVGEKLEVEVIGSEKTLLFRFWHKKNNKDWEIIKDYSMDNKLLYTVNNEGKQDILIECKRVDSTEVFDEFSTITFKAKAPNQIEISNFKCLTKNLLVNEELIFKVEATIGDKRSLLYKFLKVNKEGKAICIQDYSSKNVVSFKESEAGEYKLLCMVRDILSVAEYDDRALMVYKVKPYVNVKINNFITDMSSPQINGTKIKLKAEAEGGIELFYRYIIEGPLAYDSGYIKESSYDWTPNLEGDYILTLMCKDKSFKGECEERRIIKFTIDKKADKPVKLVDIVVDNENKILVGQPVNIKVLAEGGVKLKYSFIIYCNEKEKEVVPFGYSNWLNFTPDEKGEYKVEIKVKDKYTTKEYDSHTILYLKAKEYIPGEIDYVLLPNKNNYLIDDIIDTEVIVQNTKNVLIRYVTKINGYEVEDTGFINNKKLQINPKCSGKYTIDIYAKNVKCEGEYDSKKKISFYVLERAPIINTKITLEKDVVNVNKEITFIAESNGGKEVCYEFYIMENDNWVKVQSYSRKNRYTFIPFLKGNYKIMVLAKSFYKKVSYEDYYESSFQVV